MVLETDLSIVRSSLGCVVGEREYTCLLDGDQSSVGTASVVPASVTPDRVAPARGVPR